MYFVLVISILPVFVVFLKDFGNVRRVWYFSVCFSLYCSTPTLHPRWSFLLNIVEIYRTLEKNIVNGIFPETMEHLLYIDEHYTVIKTVCVSFLGLFLFLFMVIGNQETQYNTQWKTNIRKSFLRIFLADESSLNYIRTCPCCLFYELTDDAIQSLESVLK